MLYPILVSKKKRIHQLVDFAVSVDHRVKIKDNEKFVVYCTAGQTTKNT